MRENANAFVVRLRMFEHVCWQGPANKSRKDPKRPWHFDVPLKLVPKEGNYQLGRSVGLTIVSAPPVPELPTLRYLRRCRRHPRFSRRQCRCRLRRSCGSLHPHGGRARVLVLICVDRVMWMFTT